MIENSQITFFLLFAHFLQTSISVTDFVTKLDFLQHHNPLDVDVYLMAPCRMKVVIGKTDNGRKGTQS